MDPQWFLPLFWLLLAVLLIIVEAISFNLITTWFAIGAVAAMFVSLILPTNLTVQIITFIIVSLLVLATIRNFAVNKLKAGHIKTNVSSLIGKKGVVTKTIESYVNGEVKLEGNYWTAKSVDGTTIEANSVVEILEISGVKLIVKTID
jgi:membrane protein implicated in regulation of membrane protease activity